MPTGKKSFEVNSVGEVIFEIRQRSQQRAEMEIEVLQLNLYFSLQETSFEA